MSADLAPVRVSFFGDSICFGQGVSIHKGWVPRISRNLEDLSMELKREVVLTNASISGNTTRMALERMPYDIQSHSPDVLLVQFGMNDCNHWESDRGHPRVSARAFEANLVEIVDRAFTFGARRVFLNTNHPTGRTTQAMPETTKCYQESNQAYNGVVRSVAAQFDGRLTLIDVETAFRRHIALTSARIEDLLLPAPDLLHLSVAGHDIYYSLVAPLVSNAVKSVANEGAVACEE